MWWLVGKIHAAVVLTHWRLGNFRYLILQIISVIDGWGISCELVLRWMSLDLIDDKSTLVQVMAWCHQATSHYLNQCWPRSLLPYGFTRPQWVTSIIFKLIIEISRRRICYGITLRSVPLNLINKKSTLVQVMALCHQAPSHYLNQCWPRSPMPYDVGRPQWVKITQWTQTV